MAASDAKPFPTKNAAYRHTFEILNATGDPVTGAAALDTEISKDGAAFADCTNEAVEVGNGQYYIDLTAAEMNADTVNVVTKTSTSGAKQASWVIRPVESTDTNAWADDLFRRDPSGITGAAARSLRTLVAWIVNRKNFNAGANTMTVYDFDDTTPLLTAATTGSPAASSDVITSIDPA